MPATRPLGEVRGDHWGDSPPLMSRDKTHDRGERREHRKEEKQKKEEGEVKREKREEKTRRRRIHRRRKNGEHNQQNKMKNKLSSDGLGSILGHFYDSWRGLGGSWAALDGLLGCS